MNDETLIQEIDILRCARNVRKFKDVDAKIDDYHNDVFAVREMLIAVEWDIGAVGEVFCEREKGIRSSSDIKKDKD